MTRSGYPKSIESLCKAHGIDVNTMNEYDRAWIRGAAASREVAIRAIRATKVIAARATPADQEPFTLLETCKRLEESNAELCVQLQMTRKEHSDLLKQVLKDATPADQEPALWDSAYKALTSRYKDENNCDASYWGAFNAGIDEAIDAMREMLDVVSATPADQKPVAIYQAMATDDDPNNSDLWMDVDLRAFESMKKRSDVRVRVVYAQAPQPEAQKGTNK